MSRTGNPCDNACVESFFSTRKTECLHRHSPATRPETHALAFDSIETFYHRTRLHSALDYQSPVDFENHHHETSRASPTQTLSAKPRQAQVESVGVVRVP